jgi:hypothetical protein
MSRQDCGDPAGTRPAFHLLHGPHDPQPTLSARPDVAIRSRLARRRDGAADVPPLEHQCARGLLSPQPPAGLAQRHPHPGAAGSGGVPAGACHRRRDRRLRASADRTQQRRHHALNYNPFHSDTPSAAWTSDGFVVIEHKGEIGAAGTVPTAFVYYSACMHLGSLARHARTHAPLKAGDRVFRKEELGTPGQIYGHEGQVHFEICCDEANLEKLSTRGPDWVDPLDPTAPTANGRTDSVFGSLYIYLPAGTPTRSSQPTSHLRSTATRATRAARRAPPPTTSCPTPCARRSGSRSATSAEARP